MILMSCTMIHIVGKKSWEQAESQLMRSAIHQALTKAQLKENDVTVAFAGDLVNQIVPTHYAFREMDIPFFGVMVLVQPRWSLYYLVPFL